MAVTHVCGFAGYSGAGKTTLMAGVIAQLRAAGQRVSAIKHAHERFDIDREGKDSWRHREAGAYEVLVANGHRLALLREFEQPVELQPRALVAAMAPVDWVLVEGFKHGDLPRIEVWRAGTPALYPDDPFIVALASDDPLPTPTQRPVFARSDAAGVARYLLDHAHRFAFDPGA